MIKRIPAESRHFTDAGWLKTYWLFSFSDYYDPENIAHGTLRVFNDDNVESQSGFPDHPHRNYEIVTIVLEGELTHWDSSGNRGVIKSGDVQRMSAGSGVYHSEMNIGENPVHLYQIWVEPNEENVLPSYEQKHFNLDEKNHLMKLVSSDGKDCIKINSDSSFYFGTFESDRQIRYESNPKRKVFIYIRQGEMRINNELFKSNDQARIENQSIIVIQTIKESGFVLIDVPAV
jgi:redox-sensitive bicupin YhaK (pirin superfamily)